MPPDFKETQPFDARRPTVVRAVDDRWYEVMEDRIGDLDNQVTALRREMRDHVALGVEAGVRSLLSDEKMVKAFWERGFDEMSRRAQDSSSQWIGRRLLTTLIVALVTAGVVWLVKTGQMK